MVVIAMIEKYFKDILLNCVDTTDKQIQLNWLQQASLLERESECSHS